MKNMLKIVKKELDKIFKFPRTIFSTIILPGLLLFVIYFIIGNIASIEINKSEEYVSSVHMVNAPDSFSFALEQAEELKIDFTESSADDIPDFIEKIKDGTIDALLVYDEGFDNKIMSHSEEKPKVIVYYNANETNSNIAYNKLTSLIDSQKQNILDNLGIDPNIFSVIPEVEFDETKIAGTFLSMLLPILLVSFIFAGAMSIGADAVAGEKERGTLATLLMAPLKRNEIIIGKLISSTIINICYAVSSFIGIIAALPFMASLFDLEGIGIAYTIIDYLGLFGIILLLAIFASSLLLVTSTIAKTVKEASMYAMPIYMIVLLLPMFTMFSEGESVNRVLYLVPVYNCILGIKGVLSLNIDLLSYLMIVLSTVVYVALLIIVLVRLFKRERILFSK